ncbi:hypothetical protein [Pontibacter sp. H249]|uniref:hypothetical protein n=1 Tax=Pontibacter sp. H249 TaxID=3133420 RepID=UPI0030C5085E
MKIIVLLSASVIGFGLACKDVADATTPKQVDNTAIALEQPVAHVVLDTVEITVEAPKAIAVN